MITELSLAKGSLSDKGGALLLEEVPKHTNITLLDLEYHYMSCKMMLQLLELPIVVNVDGQQEEEVYDGELEIILYDSDGNAVYELDQAKALETYFVLEKSDTYTLEAEYTNFIGDYKIAVYKVKRS